MFSCPPLLIGDLSPLYQPVLEVLSQQAGGGELIEHPCAHWVIKKLIAVDSQRETTDPNSGELYGKTYDEDPLE